MSYATLFIAVQVIVISYLLRNIVIGTPNGISLRLINNLREQACDTSLQLHSFQGDCHAFRVPNTQNCRLGFTFSVCDDISVDATEFLKGYPVPRREFNHERTDSLTELLETFAYFFSKGSAAELRVPQDVFRSFQQRLKEVASVKDLGGNSMQMALRAAKEGCNTELAGPVSESDVRLLPLNMRVVSYLVDNPDIHLVLEYKEGDQYGGWRAPRSNRFYVNSDVHNIKPYGLHDLNPVDIDIAVIGGVQLFILDSNLESKVNELLDLNHRMHQHQKKTHFELADIRNDRLHSLLGYLLKQVDSLGFNEQELQHQLQFIQGKSVDDSSSQPSSQFLVDSLIKLLREYRAKQYIISRVHLHSVKIQIVCSTQAWSSPRVPAARAALVATQLACNSTDIQSSEVHWEQHSLNIDGQTITLTDEHPVQQWHVENFTCAAALVPYCVETKRTKSLGDNISGVGLAYHYLI